MKPPILVDVSASPLTRHLATLQAAGIIGPVASPHTGDYQFRHALLHDAAYSFLLRGQRRALHGEVGAVLEAGLAHLPDPGTLADLAPLLTLHFSLAEDAGRTWRYARLAGDSALARFATTEAADHFAHALAAHRHLPAPEPEALVEVYQRRGRALEWGARYPEAEAHYRAMESEAETHGWPAMRLSALLALNTLYSTVTPLHDTAAAARLLQQALPLARELGDVRAEANTLWNLMLFEMWGNNDYQRAAEYGETSLPLARQHHLTDLENRLLNDLAWTYLTLGRLDQALAVAAEASDHWRAAGNQPGLGDMGTLLTFAHTSRGDYPAAVAASRAGFEASLAGGNAWGQTACLATCTFALVELGEFAAANSGLDRAREIASGAGLDIHLGLGLCGRAWLFLCLGAGARAAALVEEAHQRIAGGPRAILGMPITVQALVELALGDLEAAAEHLAWSGDGPPPNDFGWPVTFWIYAGRCQLRFARGDYSGALTLVDEWQTMYAATGAGYLSDEAWLWKARALAALGHPAETLTALRTAHATAEALGSRRGLARILPALAAAEPDPQTAAALAEQARELRAALAAGIDDPELHAAWLSMGD